MKLTSRQRGLIKEAYAKLFTFMSMPLSADVVLWDLVEFQRTRRCMFDALNIAATEYFNVVMAENLANQCAYWADDWHGWDAHVQSDYHILMHKLRRISEELYKETRAARSIPQLPLDN